MSILRNDEIARLVQECQLIENCEPANVQPVGYDLRLGDEYYLDGEIHKLTETPHHVLTIPPHDLVFVSSFENVNLPSNMVGRFGLRLGLVLKGLILANGPQVDPGSKGKLFALLFNFSNKPAHIRYKEHFATVEFSYTTSPTEASIIYEGPRQGITAMREMIPAEQVRSGLREVCLDLEKSQVRTERMLDMFYIVLGITFAAIGVIVAALAILVVVK